MRGREHIWLADRCGRDAEPLRKKNIPALCAGIFLNLRDQPRAMAAVSIAIINSSLVGMHPSGLTARRGPREIEIARAK